ncbi:MAG: rod shape-determining protein MreD [Myxococcota bacterium]
MKQTLVLLAIGVAATVVQGAMNTLVPVRFTPDLGFLIVIALGVHWRSTAGGLVLATLQGFTVDLLSGSLLGEHALLRLLAFAAARAASRHLNVRGMLPQAVFVMVFTAANAVGVGTLNVFFASGGGFDVVMLRDVLPHAFVNACFAPLVIRAVEEIGRALGEDEGGRLPLRLDSRRRVV